MPETTEEILIKFVADKKKFEEDVVKMAARVKSLATQMKSDVGTIGNGLKIALPERLAPAIDEAVASLKKIEPVAKSATGVMAKFWNTTLGILTARLILGGLQIVKDFFNSAITYAQDARAQMVSLNFAESVLSKKGMDITRAELDGFISDIESKYKYLSTLEATKIVSETAVASVEFGLTKEQMQQFTDSIAFIQLKNKMMGGATVDAAHILNAAMDARSNFFNGMGINISESLILEKAYEMQLIKSGEALDKQNRFMAVMALLSEQTSAKQDELNHALEGTPLGAQMELTKNYSNALQVIGEDFLTVKDNIIQFLASFSPALSDSIIQFFSDLVDKLNATIDALQLATDTADLLGQQFPVLEEAGTGFVKILSNIWDAITPFEILLSILQGIGTAFAMIGAAAVTFIAEMSAGFGISQSFHDAGVAASTAFVNGMSMSLATLLKGEDGAFSQAIKKYWMDNFKIDLDTFNLPKTPDTKKDSETPTGIPDTKNVETEQSDLEKALAKFNEAILEAQLKLEQDMEEAAIDMGRKLVDIAIEYGVKRAEAEREYASKIADINRSYADKIADIESSQSESRQKARNDELEREKDFQNKMQEMKEDFLMDLEDALHSRDARQILKLAKKYELEKLQAERQHQLDKENAARAEALRQQSYERQKAEAEAERIRKLEDAKREYEDKLAKLKIEEEAERAAANLAYERKKQDLEREMQNRLEQVASGLVSEFKLTKAGLDAMAKLYGSYYSYIRGIYDAMNKMRMGLGTAEPRSGGRGDSGWSKPISGSGASAVPNFQSPRQSSRNNNSMFSSLSGGGSNSGKVSIEVVLSPDLESRIVSNTLSQTAEVFTKVQRGKR